MMTAAIIDTKGLQVYVSTEERAYSRRVHFVTFASPDYGCTRITEEAKEALSNARFDTVSIYRDWRLGWRELCPELFPPSQHLGYGFFVWKPMVIEHALMNRAQEGDIVVYADAGCVLRHASPEWNFWFSEAANFDVMAFQIPHIKEREFTKRATFGAFGLTPEGQHSQSPMAVGCASVWVNTPASRALVNDWVVHCAQKPLIDDEVGSDEHVDFKAHRHDQSIFSLLLKTRVDAGSVRVWVLNDATYPDLGARQAIWAARMKG